MSDQPTAALLQDLKDRRRNKCRLSLRESASFRGAKGDNSDICFCAGPKQRGMLESTIVLWGGEFGRLPIAQNSDGRDHNRHGFSMWIAGGGFRSGYEHGQTDEFGYRCVRDIVTVHDLHATLLQAFGINHLRLTYPRAGIATSLTDAAVSQARVISSLLN